MQWNDQLDDEPITDSSVPVAGVNNSLPPSAIPQNLAADEYNRLAQNDGLNRPRPGFIQRATLSGNVLDSISHIGSGVFYCNNASSWYTYDYNANTLTARTGPAYGVGAQVASAMVNDTLYFSAGGPLSKYSTAGGYGTVALPTQYPQASFPLWAANRLTYVFTGSSTMVVSDILAPEVFDPITQTVTLDPLAGDVITGQGLWQSQRLAVFRNGSSWIIETGPDLPVANWELNRVSGSVGCCCHGTIAQVGTDVYFLSETGRGVYNVSQMPSSAQYGVLSPVSAPIKAYINRINWSAIKNSRAVIWNDLYMLSVPLDGVTYNNAILVYSISLGTWQGIWAFDVGGMPYGARDFARDRTNPDQTVLLMGVRNGWITRWTYPTELQNFDSFFNGSRTYFNSRLLSRSFTFNESINQIQPHSIRLQFLESVDPVDVTIYADRTIQLIRKNTSTTGSLLMLPIAKLPFDLDKSGYHIFPMSLLSVGVCDEIQVQLEATGNWTLFQIKALAFEAAPELTL